MLHPVAAPEQTIFLTKPSYTSSEIEDLSGVGPQTIGAARRAGELIGARLGREFVHPAHSVAAWLTSRAKGQIDFVVVFDGGDS